jgi:hypothetical protein
MSVIGVKSILLEAGEEPIKDALAANLTLVDSIVTLAPEDGRELGCGDEVGA